MVTASVPPAWPAPPELRKAPVVRIVLALVGAALLFTSLWPGFFGAFLTGAYAFGRDADGFFTTPTERLDTGTYAITSGQIDLGARDRAEEGTQFFGHLGTIRFTATPRNGRALFIGIAPQAEADRYLSRVAHDEIESVGVGSADPSYRYRPGGPPPAPPSRWHIWVAGVQGRGQQELRWRPSSGRWTVVLMNASGARRVDADVSVGVKTPWVLPVGIGLLAVAFVVFVVGVVLLVVGLVGLRRRRPAGT